MMKWRNLVGFVILLIITLLPAFTMPMEKADKIRRQASNYYRAGDFKQALSLLTELLEADKGAFFWMDYAMAADIYLQQGKPDSAKWIISEGAEKTETASDIRVIRRNREVWANLNKQLKHKRPKLEFPTFKRLEMFADENLDTTAVEATIIDQIEELLFATKIESAPLKSEGLKSSKADSVKKISGIEASQSDSAEATEINAKEHPQIRGGIAGLKEYIRANALFPDSARKAAEAYGAAVVRVHVDADGKPENIEVLRVRPAGMGFEELAIEVFRAAEYIPAVSDSVKVAANLQIPVLFQNPEPLNLPPENPE